jgi:hypothetical protein
MCRPLSQFAAEYGAAITVENDWQVTIQGKGTGCELSENFGFSSVSDLENVLQILSLNRQREI